MPRLCIPSDILLVFLPYSPILRDSFPISHFCISPIWSLSFFFCSKAMKGNVCSVLQKHSRCFINISYSDWLLGLDGVWFTLLMLKHAPSLEAYIWPNPNSSPLATPFPRDYLCFYDCFSPSKLLTANFIRFQLFKTVAVGGGAH